MDLYLTLPPVSDQPRDTDTGFSVEMPWLLESRVRRLLDAPPSSLSISWRKDGAEWHPVRDSDLVFPGPVDSVQQPELLTGLLRGSLVTLMLSGVATTQAVSAV